jgi:PKD repeat protein
LRRAVRNISLLLASLLLASVTVGVMGCSGGEEATPTQSTCRADFYAKPTELDSPAQVRFIDRSTGEITGWAWDFNENGTIDSTKQNPTYYYDANGTYSVTLTVTGPGCENTYTE